MKMHEEMMKRFNFIYKDKYNHEISLEQFGALCVNFEYKSIGRDQIGPWLISTVWVGIVASKAPFPAHIFETMVFHDDDGMKDQDFVEQYETLEQAIQGHEEVVKEYEEKLKNET